MCTDLFRPPPIFELHITTRARWLYERKLIVCPAGVFLKHSIRSHLTVDCNVFLFKSCLLKEWLHILFSWRWDYSVWVFLVPDDNGIFYLCEKHIFLSTIWEQADFPPRCTARLTLSWDWMRRCRLYPFVSLQSWECRLLYGVSAFLLSIWHAKQQHWMNKCLEAAGNTDSFCYFFLLFYIVWNRIDFFFMEMVRCVLSLEYLKPANQVFKLCCIAAVWSCFQTWTVENCIKTLQSLQFSYDESSRKLSELDAFTTARIFPEYSVVFGWSMQEAGHNGISVAVLPYMVCLR